MAIDLVIGLIAIAAKAVVTQLVRGAAPDTEDWAGVASEIAGAVVAGAASAAPQRAGRAQASAVRDFDLRMRAGRRYVGDLPAAWRTERDRLEMTRDARHEFVHAASIAGHMNDYHRQAEAEIAIAGCWLWVPSLGDARKAMRSARQMLLQAKILDPRADQAYEEVTELCRAYGAIPARANSSSLESRLRSPRTPPAVRPSPLASPSVLTMELEYGAWAQNDSVAIRFHTLRIPQAEYDEPETTTASGLVIPETAKEQAWFDGLLDYEGEPVPLIVKNSRAEWISMMMTYDAIGVVLPSAQNTLPAEGRVAPGAQAEIFLERPERDAPFPHAAAMVFTLPRQQPR